MRWRAKGAEWLRRYGLAEVAGTSTALAGAFVVRALTGNEIAAAYGAALGENVGYYGVILGFDVARGVRAARARGARYGVAGALLTLRDLVLEFGFAEAFDSAVVRPLAMAAGVRLFGREAGILAGKLAADVVFYVPVICAYELRRIVSRPARVRSPADD